MVKYSLSILVNLHSLNGTTYEGSDPYLAMLFKHFPRVSND